MLLCMANSKDISIECEIIASKNESVSVTGNTPDASGLEYEDFNK